MRIIRTVWQSFVIVFIAVVAIVCGSLLASPGAWAHPYNTPQIGDFVPGSFNCTGEVAFDGERFVEFSGSWQGKYNALIRLVEYKDGRELSVTDSNLFAGVDSRIQYGTNVLGLMGTGGDSKYIQNVVFTLKPVEPNREFGVVIKNAPNGEEALLARWTATEKYKCGVPILG